MNALDPYLNSLSPRSLPGLTGLYSLTNLGKPSSYPL